MSEAHLSSARGGAVAGVLQNSQDGIRHPALQGKTE